MEELKKAVNSHIHWSKLKITVIVLAVIFGIWYLVFGKNGIFKLQQNIYFMEWNTEDKSTIFYRYSPKDDKVIELGKIEGKLQHCVINKEETCFTGVRDNGEFWELIRYDLPVGIFQTEDIGKKIDALTGGAEWGALLLYDEGNKMLVSYEESRNEKWLFYDFLTDEYRILEAEKYEETIAKYKVGRFLAVDDNEIWYVTGATLRKYNLETGKDTKILYSFNSVAVSPNKEFIYYVESGIYDKKIYRYNVETNMIKCILSAGWSTYYGNMFDKEGQWSDDGKYFFYVKHFPILFNAANKSLMVYNTRTGRSFCIYKEWNTYNQFRYIGSSG